VSASVPIRRKDFDVPGFVAWLAFNGAEIGIPTNAYEVVRYLAHAEGHRKPVTHIVYAKETGILTYMPGTREHYAQFLGIEGDGSLKGKMGAAQRKNMRAAIVARDGPDCWFCGKATTKSTESIEHLVPRSKGGPDALANFVLAHTHCNRAAGDMDLNGKIALRDKLRACPTPLPSGSIER